MFKQFFVKGGVTAPTGFFADAEKMGLKKDDFDLSFIYSEKIANVGAIFTSNKFLASPILHFKKHKIEKTNFILINSKNANAMRGQEGVSDIEKIFDILKTKLPITNPIMSSTGVIGEPLPVKKIIDGALKFNLTNKNSLNAARGIMTTDTYPKEIAVKVQLEDGREYFVGGMAKGAGMINPSMATMLAFITTDLKIPNEKINELLRELTKTTFNAISVDGDTSTNDSVFLLANGEKDFYDEVSFKATLEIVMKHLALEIVRDGEGATKLVSFRITGAKTNEDAEKIAKKLADSILVKTAFFGQDPNWGRIAMAIGASGVSVSEEKLSIYYNDLPIFVQGKNLWNDEVEEKAFEIMKNKQFVINCNLGLGDGSFTSYSSDIGYKYVQINSEYRS
jgi:glutamate N-acetyltransferase/amino-acid N-acetyltransferase